MATRLRLISGIVLFIFVLSHFTNHMFGIVSLSAMDAGLYKTVELWRTPLGSVILTLAILVHVVLALYALYARRSLRLSKTDYVQFASGLLIPLLLTAHVASTRGAYQAFGLEGGYQLKLYDQWIKDPTGGIMATCALFVVWIHGCIGWHNWLKFKRWYPRIRPFALAIAVLVPALATAGIVSGIYRVLRASRSEKWIANVTRDAERLGEALPQLVNISELVMRGFLLGAVVLLASVYLLRRIQYGLPGGEQLVYRSMTIPDKRPIKLREGSTVLDMLRGAGIEHASVCGGRGRCSTCRIMVEAKGEELPSPNANEQRVLDRIGSVPNVRLACQLKPKKSLAVTALLSPAQTGQLDRQDNRSVSGDEQEIAVLFADIRSFTSLSEAQLPFDTAFMLNRYFAAMGKAIEGAGGHLDKFIGDGVMAIFGIDDTPQTGCRNALVAARAMAESLETLNQSLEAEIGQPIRIGIGIHYGTAIVGRMGYGHATGLTAIGDVVNTASRLESMTKDLQVQLIVSQRMLKQSGLAQEKGAVEQVRVRGRDEPLTITKFNSALDLKL